MTHERAHRDRERAFAETPSELFGGPCDGAVMQVGRAVNALSVKDHVKQRVHHYCRDARGERRPDGFVYVSSSDLAGVQT